MNSNLTPEKRLDKNGRLVTKHVNNSAREGASDSKRLGVLSRLFPGAAPSPARIEFNGLIEQGYAEECAIIKKKHSRSDELDPGDGDISRRVRDHSLEKALIQKNDVLKESKKYSEDTIKLINDSAAVYGLSPDHVFAELRRDGRSETETREYFTYAGTLGKVRAKVLMDQVRDSLGMDDTSSEPYNEGINAVYEVAFLAREQRYEKYVQAAVSDDDDFDSFNEFEAIGKLAATRRQMTPELAQIILENPDRASEITRYIEQRNGNNIETLDMENLRDYINTSARVLTDGTL